MQYTYIVGKFFTLFFAVASKQHRKAKWLNFLPVSDARTNKCYIFRQCTYIVYIYLYRQHNRQLYMFTGYMYLFQTFLSENACCVKCLHCKHFHTNLCVLTSNNLKKGFINLLQWYLYNPTPEFSDTRWHPKHLHGPWVCRIRQIPLYVFPLDEFTVKVVIVLILQLA